MNKHMVSFIAIVAIVLIVMSGNSVQREIVVQKETGLDKPDTGRKEGKQMGKIIGLAS